MQSHEYWTEYSELERRVKDDIIIELAKYEPDQEIIFDDQVMVVCSPDDTIKGIKCNSDDEIYVLIEMKDGEDVEWEFVSDTFNVVDYIWILEQLQNEE